MRLFWFMATALLLTVAAPAKPEPVAAKAATLPAEVSIPNSRRVRFTSSVNGRDYVVSIALPLHAPPPEGYPVLYVLDPHFVLGTAVDAARVSAPDVVVVGIGYPLDDPDFVDRTVGGVKHALPDSLRNLPQQTLAVWTLRTHDLTLPATAEVRRTGSAPEVAELSASLSGGLDAFLEVIEREVKPRVAKEARVDAGREALFGHSLGGMAVLHALFTRPDAFDQFIAASPSIWAAPALWEEQQAFANRVSHGRQAPAILLTVGAREQDRIGAKSKMVDNMREMARRLRQSASADRPIHVVDLVFADEDHGSVQQASVSRAIGFAFRPPDRNR